MISACQGEDFGEDLESKIINIQGDIWHKRIVLCLCLWWWLPSCVCVYIYIHIYMCFKIYHIVHLKLINTHTNTYTHTHTHTEFKDKIINLSQPLYKINIWFPGKMHSWVLLKNTRSQKPRLDFFKKISFQTQPPYSKLHAFSFFLVNNFKHTHNKKNII